jgi:hypothetical protein
VDNTWNLIGPIIHWLRMFAKPSELVNDCFRSRDENDWETILVKFWITPILISIAIDATLVLNAYRSDLLSYTPVLLLYFLYSALKWLIAAIAIHLALLGCRISSRFGVVISCYKIAVWYAPFYSVLDSPSFAFQLRVLSQVKAQNLGILSSIKYFTQHATEMAPGTELQTTINALQSGSSGVRHG